MPRAPKPKPKRLLAIDTSSSPGFAVLEWVDGGNVKLVYADAVKTDTKLTDAQRYSVAQAMTSIVCFRYGPFEDVCREHFTKAGSKRGTQLVFGGWAAVDLALNQFGYTIAEANEFTPSAVKKAMTGSGSAPKTRKEAEDLFRRGKRKTVEKSVEDGVIELLGLPADYEFPNNAGGDTSDAVAIGLTYLKREGAIG